MSRRCTATVALIALAAVASPCLAQEVSAEDRAVARGLLASKGQMAPALRRRCEAPRGNDIVVCAQNNEQFRAQSSAQENPQSDQALNDGRLATPDVSGNGIFKGKPTMGSMCLIPPCPPAPAYMIDLSSIPEAPVGSDADKIAKGEIRAP